MENYMRSEYKKLQEDEKITELIENVKSRSEKKNPKSETDNSRPKKWSVSSSNWEESY